MLRTLCYHFLLVFVGILPVTSNVSASFNYSACAHKAYQIFSSSPNNNFLYDQQGRLTGSLDDAWGISYKSCNILCGTEDNTEFYDWNFLSQGISSWLIPWLALSAQLPFETKNKTTNVVALLLTLGSPAIAAYSLALTLLNARRINQKFRRVREENQWLHRPLQIKAIKAARSILIETQHVPIQIYNGQRREISQLIVRPENWAWWCSLRQKLLTTKRKWTYSLYAQVGWVCVSQLLAIIDFFTATSTSGSSIDIGLAINSLWLWMIPIVLGWVYVGTQNSAASIKAALTDTDVPTLGSERHFSGECIGLRDRTTHDYFSVLSQHSSDSNEPPYSERRRVRGAANISCSALENSVVDNGLQTEQTKQEYINSSSSLDASALLQRQTSSHHHGSVHANASDDIELQTLAVDLQVDTSSTLQANEQESQSVLDAESPFSLLPQTFLGFSIAGDDHAPGPIYNYARIWTHTNAINRIAESFLLLTNRQQQQVTVHGREWEQDPKRWNENLKGTPKQMSQYLSPFNEDVPSIPIHVQASTDLIHNCITAALIAVCLQWGTTGAAIVIAYNTPTVGLGCQSGSYLIYGLASTVAWLALTSSACLSHLYSLRLESSHHRRRPSTLLAAIAVLTRLLGKLLASANAIFVIATSIIQFTGLFDNCWCDACIPSLGKAAGWVVLFASDEQLFRASKGAWVGGVFMAIVVGGIISLWIFIARGDEVFAGDEV